MKKMISEGHESDRLYYLADHLSSNALITTKPLYTSSIVVLIIFFFN